MANRRSKTQIALKYAYWCRENYKNTSIFWVNASTFEKFHQSFMELAKHLRIPGAESPKADILGLVRNWLSQEKECGTWVMILHDADDFSTLFEPSESQGQSSFPGKLADYIPKCQHGSILITTRDKQVATRMVKGLGPLIQIPPMGTSESIDLLSKILKGEEYEEKDIEKLADALEHLPLALSQAAAFILENSVSIGIYLQLLRDNRTNAFELLNDDTTGAEAHSAVTTTWIMSFTQIRERNPRAADILSLMAFLDRQDVPADLIKRHYETLSGLEFERACGVLKAFSLINERQLTIHGENHRTFNMQQLVQQATRQWLETHDKSSQQWEENALIAVAKVFPPGEGDDWKKFEIYLPHVQVVLERKIESILGTDAKADLLHHASSYFRVKGYHARAAEMGRETVEIRKQSLGVQHPKTLASHTNLSRILLEQKKVNEARELMAEAVAAAESTVEKSDRDMLRARGHLAALLGIQEKYRDAKHLQKSVVEMSKTALGEEHLDTLLAMRDLAVTYGHRKPYDKAEPLFRRVLENRKRKLGPDHPETLTSMLDLAEILRLQDPEKNAPKAEVLASQVVEGRKRALGDEHPATLLAMDTLATTYEWQDRWGEAEALREQIRRFSSIGCKDPENHPQSALRIMSYEITTYKLPKPESRPWPSPDQARKFSTLSNDSMPTLAPAPSLGPDGDEKMDIRKMKSWTDLKRAVVAISDSIFTSELAIKSDEKISTRTSRSCGDVKSSAIEITTPGGGNGEGRDDDGSGIGSLGGESNYSDEQFDKKAPIKDDKPNHNEEQVEKIASTETSQTEEQADKKSPIGRDGKNQTEEQVEKRTSTDGAEAIQTGEHAEKKASTEGAEANRTKEVEKRASTDCGETTQTKERIEQIAPTNDLRPPVDRIITSSSPLLVPWARLEQQWRKRSPLDRFRDRIHSSQDTVAEGQVRREMEEGRRKSAE
jgi:tetratricopeptide (TPR) repeat protein